MKAAFNKYQLREIHGLLDKISTLKAHEVITGFRRGVLVLENRVKLNVSGGVLKTRSGRLRNSISSTVREKQGQLAGYVGSGQRTGKPAVYADILETGGIIRPVKRQWPTVPTRHALAPSGAAKLSAPEVKNGFFARAKNGSLILFEGGRKTPRPMFVLKKMVKIAGRHYLALSLAQGEQEAYDCLAEGLKRLTEGK